MKEKKCRNKKDFVKFNQSKKKYKFPVDQRPKKNKQKSDKISNETSQKQ